MKYFNNVHTLEELRKQYKELLKKYHPDNPKGSTEATQEINAEYDILFKTLKNKHEKNTSDKEAGTSNSKSKYDFTNDAILREMLQKIIHFSDATIEIIGDWIWVSGNTYSYKNQLKELGFKWASQKKMWFWHSDDYIKKSRKVLSIDDIRNYYGSTEVKTEKRKMLKEA